MKFGTAVLILGLIYLAIVSPPFRMISLGVIAIAGGTLLALMSFGADKPQTLFYDYASHPAYLMQPGRICPVDRHIWNGWCVK